MTYLRSFLLTITLFIFALPVESSEHKTLDSLRQKARKITEQPLDPRVHPYNNQEAAFYLKGHVPSPHSLHPSLALVSKPVINVYEPDLSGKTATQLLYNEYVDVYKTTNGYYWVQNLKDGYVGLVKQEDITILPDKAVESPLESYIISTPKALVYTDADIKSVPIDAYFLGTRITGTKENKFLKTDKGFIPLVHLASDLMTPDNQAKALTDIALKFLGSPYLWGGKTYDGIDCSGLLQVSLQQLDIDCPRDSDQQRKAIGSLVEDHTQLQQGDIIFFKGHVGIMLDNKNIIHANGATMDVSIMTLLEAKALRSEIIAVKRL